MQPHREPVGLQLARWTVRSLAVLAVVLVPIGLYAQVLHSAVQRGPLLRTPPPPVVKRTVNRANPCAAPGVLSAACIQALR